MSNSKKDKQYDELCILDFVRNKMKGSPEYQNIVKDKGLKIGEVGNKDKYFVYSYGLATFLISKDIKVFDRIKNKNIVIEKGSVYINSFKKGFNKGREYFISEFKNNPYQSKETIVKTLHDYYYNKTTEEIPCKGWRGFTEPYYPVYVSNEIIETWGFYNGVIYELKEFTKLNSELFKNFYKPSVADIYPFKEQKYFEYFINYVNKHIVEPYLDHSYLFQRLLKQRFIEKVKHKDFIEFLYDKGFIKEKTYNNFKIKNGFYALKKCTKADRENNFNNTFKL